MHTFEYVLLNCRLLYVLVYIVPVCLICNIIHYLKTWIVSKIYSSPKQHDAKTRNIQKQIHQWIKSGKKLLMKSSCTGCQNVGYRQMLSKNSYYDIKMNLIDILEIDNEKQIVRVEPLVTIGQLISTLLPLGWTIPVVPGCDDLTVGSIVMGSGLDSSSHKYGSFHKTCLSYELVLSDGSIVVCSEINNPDLFYAVPWSYGTLGLLTAVEIKLIPAHNFVKLQFMAYHNEDLALKRFIEECNDKKNDFVEGIMYSENQCVLVVGQMVDQIEENKLNELGKWYKPWFYHHVKSYFIKGFGVEYVPLKDYYFRHTRSTYWELKEIIPFGNNILFRLLFGWTVPSKLSFIKMTQAGIIKDFYKKRTLMLDLMVPSDKMRNAIDTLNEKADVYPLWLCPVKLTDTPGFVHSYNPEELFVNIGIYGTPKAQGYHTKKTLKEIETFVREIKGFRTLNGNFHMSEDEFRKQFDHTLYDQLRTKLDCDKAFPTVFEKLTIRKNENPYYKKWKEWIME